MSTRKPARTIEEQIADLQKRKEEQDNRRRASLQRQLDPATQAVRSANHRLAAAEARAEDLAEQLAQLN